MFKPEGAHLGRCGGPIFTVAVLTAVFPPAVLRPGCGNAAHSCPTSDCVSCYVAAEDVRAAGKHAVSAAAHALALHGAASLCTLEAPQLQGRIAPSSSHRKCNLLSRSVQKTSEDAHLQPNFGRVDKPVGTMLRRALYQLTTRCSLTSPSVRPAPHLITPDQSLITNRALPVHNCPGTRVSGGSLL